MNAPEVNGPQDLPKLRLYLLHLWRKNGPMDRIVATGEPFALPGQDPKGRSWSEWERYQLANAELWWVSKDMTDLTQAVSKSIPADVKPPDIRIPSDAGLIVFEKPWMGVDARNTEVQVAVSAVLWGRTNLGKLAGRDQEPPVEAVSFSCYEYLPEWVNLNPPKADGSSGLRVDQIKRFLDSGGEIDTMIYNGQRFSTQKEINHLLRNSLDERKDDLVSVRVSGGSNWLPLGRSDWPLVDKITDPITQLAALADSSLNVDASFQEDRRMMAAFWTLVQTTRISTVARTRAPRPERRRYERAGHNAALSDVRIVQLRKLEREAPETPVGGHRKVEWSCQWPVTAHAKMQPYGPGRSLRKLIIVGPFLKGPPDKPLRVRQEVKAFVR